MKWFTKKTKEVIDQIREQFDTKEFFTVSELRKCVDLKTTNVYFLAKRIAKALNFREYTITIPESTQKIMVFARNETIVQQLIKTNIQEELEDGSERNSN